MVSYGDMTVICLLSHDWVSNSALKAAGCHLCWKAAPKQACSECGDSVGYKHHQHWHPHISQWDALIRTCTYMILYICITHYILPASHSVLSEQFFSCWHVSHFSPCSLLQCFQHLGVAWMTRELRSACTQVLTDCESIHTSSWFYECNPLHI